MEYLTKRTFPVGSTNQLKKLVTCGLILGFLLMPGLPLQPAAAQGECMVDCSVTVPTAANVNESVTFTAMATATGCATSASVEWDFGDGTPRASQATTTHAYAGPGTYMWQMTASANSSLTTIDTVAGGYGEGAPVRQASFTVPTVIARDPLGRGLFVVDESSAGNFVWFINTTGEAVMIGGKKIEAGTRRALVSSLGSALTSPNPFDIKASQVGIVASGLAVSNDGALLYISDESLSLIWVYNISGGSRTVFGNTLSPGNVGVLVSAVTPGLGALAVHPTSGEVYFLGSQTGSNRVYKITGIGQTQIVAGNGAATQPSEKFPDPSPGQQLDATAVPLLNPRDIAFDSAGNLYIADSGHARIVKVDAAGKITLVSQLPVEPVNAFPSALAVRGNEVYVATGNQQTILRLVPEMAVLAGMSFVSCDYTTSNCGDGGTAANAKFNLQNSSNLPPLVGLEADANGLYILDQGNSQRGRIRYLNLSSSGVIVLGRMIAANGIDTVAGNGLMAPFDNGLAISSLLSNPTGVAVDANGNLFISDTPRATIRFVNRGKSIVTLFAGTTAERVVPPGAIVTLNNEAGAGAGENTTVNQASFDNPQGLFATSQGVFVADSKKGPAVNLMRTGLIRFINTSSATVNFYPASGKLISIPPGQIGTIAGGAESLDIGNGQFATEAKFLAPADVVVHPTQNHIYVADVASRAVRKINGSTGIVTSLNLPESFYTGLGIDPNGRLYIADYSNGQILRETAAGSESFEKMNTTPIANPRDVAVDAAGNAYVVIGGEEQANGEFKILRITASGQVETVAGSTLGFEGDGGPAANAKLATFASPISLGGINLGPFFPQTINIALAANGEVIFADTGNNRIRRIGTGSMTCIKTGTITISGNNPSPTLAQIAPNFVLLGRPATVVINGTGFVPSSTVRWNGQDRPTTFISNTQLLASIPVSDTGTTGTAQVSVFNPAPGGGTSNSLTLPISRLNPIPGNITLSPNTAAVGTAFTLTVNGSNFVNGSLVYWNGTPRPTTFVSSMVLQAQIPATDLVNTGNVSVLVSNPEPGGGLSAATSFRITATNPVPALTALQPGAAVSGGTQFQLTVMGTNFAVNSVVRWNGQDRQTIFVNSMTLLAVIPALDIVNAGSAQVTVFTPTPGGGTTTAATFFVGNQATTVPATFFSGNTVAPDSIASVFGVDLATGIEVATSLPLPTTLAGTTVTVRDAANKEFAASLFFVSPTQINFLIPGAAATGAATIIIKSGSNVVGVGTVSVATINPGLFSANATGMGVAAGVALRLSGGTSAVFEPLVRFENSQFVAIPLDLGPATDQIYLVVYGSGLRGRTDLSQVTATVGGVDVPVVYAGEAPDLIGVDQINIGPLPRSLAGRGSVDIVLRVDGRATNTVQVTIK